MKNSWLQTEVHSLPQFPLLALSPLRDAQRTPPAHGRIQGVTRRPPKPNPPPRRAAPRRNATRLAMTDRLGVQKDRNLESPNPRFLWTVALCQSVFTRREANPLQELRRRHHQVVEMDLSWGIVFIGGHRRQANIAIGKCGVLSIEQDLAIHLQL